MDLVKEILDNKPAIKSHELFKDGVGADDIDMDQAFLLVSQHPVTTEFGEGEKQITETLKACDSIGLPTLVLWPNSDAGSEDISRGIRK